jgi:hypothetical protein
MSYVIPASRYATHRGGKSEGAHLARANFVTAICNPPKTHGKSMNRTICATQKTP